MSDDLYRIAREVTDEVMGEGTYAAVNAGNPDPRVKAEVDKSGFLPPDQRDRADRAERQLTGAVKALERLANLKHRARTEEGTLIQAEVVAVAQAALDRLKSDATSR